MEKHLKHRKYDIESQLKEVLFNAGSGTEHEVYLRGCLDEVNDLLEYIENEKNTNVK